ncbi:MAG TPA: SLC13 family permease [Planctomycetota bacterium]|nr:SLC13 family permease [Planctomycetota bacterium]
MEPPGSPLLRSTVILGLTFGGCSLRKIPFLPIDRPTICLLGGIATVVLGVLPVDRALESVKLDVLALLLGMMIVAGGLAEAGVYGRLASRLESTARLRPRLLLALVLLGGGALSALVTNDTVCVFFAPLVIELARAAGRRPLPYLLALALAANTGSAATLVGNPQNMIVGSDAAAAASRLTFARYALLATPIALAGLAASFAALVIFHRRELAAPPEAGTGAPPRTASDPWLARVSVGALLVALVLLLSNVPLAFAALVAAGLLLALGRRDPRRFYGHVDVGLLVLFGGLFVVTAGAHASGVIDAIAARFAPDAASPFATQAVSMSVFTTAGSQVVSNVPFVLATTPIVDKLPQADGHRALLALVSTFAGNLTLLGSIANLIVAGAAQHDEPVGFFEHLRVGLPVTIFQVVVATAAVVLYVRLGWL